jgi:putative tricarboxylic transport membrane protein
VNNGDTEVGGPASRTVPGTGSGAPKNDDEVRGRAEDSAVLHILLNLVFLVGFAFLFYAAGDLPDSRWEPLGSGTFPRIVLGSLMLLNATIIIMKLGAARGEIRERGRNFHRIVGDALGSSLLVIATFGLFGVFLVAIPLFGFVLSAFLFILILQLLLGPITVKSVIVASIVAAVTAIGVDYVFENYFNVFLPQARLWR